MTLDTVTVPAASGAALTGTFTVNPVTPVYAYPVSKYAAVAHASDTFAAAIARPTADTILDMANAPTTQADFLAGFWNSGGGNCGGYGVLAGTGNHTMGFLNLNHQVTPNSFTNAALANALTTGQTNNFDAIRLGAGSSKVTSPVLTGKFTGTPQNGALYNGPILYYTTNAVVGPLVIKAVPGAGGAPPTETFPLSQLHSTGTVYNLVEIDGTDANGTPVSSSGIGNNSSSNFTYNQPYVHDCIHGAGITQYLCTGTVTVNQGRFFRNGLAGINVEQFGGGILHLNQCQFQGNKVHLLVDANNGSAKVTIIDPIYDGAMFTVTIHPTYEYGQPAGTVIPNTQKASDITLIINGVSRPDLLSIVSQG